MSNLNRACRTCGAEGGTCKCYLKALPPFDFTGPHCACGNYLTAGQTVCAACAVATFVEHIETVVAQREVGLKDRIARRWPGYDPVGEHAELVCERRKYAHGDTPDDVFERSAAGRGER